MTLEEFCNMAISNGDGTTFWVEELTESDMDGAGFSESEAVVRDSVSLCFRTIYKAGVVLAEDFAKAQVVHFHAVEKDVVWVTVLLKSSKYKVQEDANHENTR